MDILHASALLSRLFERLPQLWHDWVYGGLAGITVFFLCVTVWKVSHSSETLPHGETRTVWYPPTQWLRRWNELSEQGRGRGPSWLPRLMMQMQRLSNWIGAFMGVMLGLICLGIAWAFGLQGLMPVGMLAIACALASFWFARHMVRGRPDDE